MYDLDDNTTKVLIGSRLRGRALDWFHSKSEHIADQPTSGRAEGNVFSSAKQGCYEKAKIEFGDEARHSANIYMTRLYWLITSLFPTTRFVIDGISNPALRDQARIQRFGSTRVLLEAFEKITIRPRGQSSGVSGG